MGTLTIYYFTLLGCIYWMLLTIHFTIKINVYNSFWFIGFIIFHFCFFIYWYFDSLGWRQDVSKTDIIDDNNYSFNPFNGKVKAFNNSSLSYQHLTKEVKNDLIDTNIPLSCNLLILFNIIFGLSYSLCLFVQYKKYFI